MDAYDLVGRVRGWDEGAGHRSARLAAAMARAIEDGRLPAGTRLPAERRLADALRISRGTVVRAYARLRDDGLAHTRHGSGTVVGPAEPVPWTRRTAAAGLSGDGVSAATVDASDHEAIDLRCAAWDADDETLRLLASPSPAELRAAAHGSIGYWPLGHPSLREAIADRLTSQGLPTEPAQVVVTAGAQQAVDLVLTTMTRPGDPVVVEETTWPGMAELLALRQLRPATVAEAARDHVGLLRALRERRADLAYLIATHHNPTGAVLPTPARRLVVEAAAEGGVLVVDDVSLADLWIDEPPPPPLAAVVADLAEHVITVGSLSKPFWGGLRLGWIRAEPRLAAQLGRVKSVVDLGGSLAPQLTAIRVLGALDELLASRRQRLAQRRTALTTALEEMLPDWGWTTPAGGMSLWADLAGVSGDALAAAAAGHGVLVPPARACSAVGRDLSGVRLTLSRPVDELELAVARLAGAWDEVRDRTERVPAVG